MNGCADPFSKRQTIENSQAAQRDVTTLPRSLNARIGTGAYGFSGVLVSNRSINPISERAWRSKGCPWRMEQGLSGFVHDGVYASVGFTSPIHCASPFIIRLS